MSELDQAANGYHIKPLSAHLRMLEGLEPGCSQAPEERSSDHETSTGALGIVYQQFAQEPILIPNYFIGAHMKISDAFPSNFFKADDLKNKTVSLTIESVAMEEVGDGTKPVVYFKGQNKGLVLNKTNAAMIEEIAATDEMDDWGGVRVVLYPARVDFQGKRVPAIRVDFLAEAKADPAPVAAEDDISL